MYVLKQMNILGKTIFNPNVLYFSAISTIMPHYKLCHNSVAYRNKYLFFTHASADCLGLSSSELGSAGVVSHVSHI